jgi:concanavalin A-like lectin/glucanase superfamily protein
VLRTDGSYTVSVWALLTERTSQTLVSQRGTRTAGFTIGYDATIDRWYAEVPASDSDHATVTRLVVNASPDARGETWAHLVLTYDATARMLRLFLGNNVSVPAPADEAPVTVAWRAPGQFVAGAGRRAPGAGQRAGRLVDFWTGRLDEVQVYGRMLTARELQDLI